MVALASGLIEQRRGGACVLSPCLSRLFGCSGDNTPYDGYHAVQSLLELEIELVVEVCHSFLFVYVCM